MSFKVLKKERLTPSAYLLEVEEERAPLGRPGQFALLLPRLGAQPVPLTPFKKTENSLTFLVEVRGRASLELAESEELQFVEYPCGKPFPVKNYGKVLLVGKNWGIAPLVGVGEALKEAGSEVYYLQVAETEERAYPLAEELILFTEDGSLGEEGNAEWAFRWWLERFGKPDLVVSAGPNLDAKLISEVAKEKGIKHLSMVNAPVLDACGLCISCRVLVEGEEKLACTDGLWFDGEKVDWDYAVERELLYAEEEELALKEFLKRRR